MVVMWCSLSDNLLQAIHAQDPFLGRYDTIQIVKNSQTKPKDNASLLGGISEYSHIWHWDLKNRTELSPWGGRESRLYRVRDGLGLCLFPTSRKWYPHSLGSLKTPRFRSQGGCIHSSLFILPIAPQWCWNTCPCSSTPRQEANKPGDNSRLSQAEVWGPFPSHVTDSSSISLRFC